MSSPVVTVQQGKLLGKISKDIFGGLFYSFQGIPYAKPPTGILRFKAPKPPDPWVGVRNATKEGNVCFSRDSISKAVVGSEDCLYLNVFTKQISKPGEIPLKPVMVWLHGGAFRTGSGNSDMQGPEYLLTEDIVLVTINYRLGIFGFLSFEDTSLEVPGNAGLKDMVLALKWVQKNIINFSGDPNNVTLFGESSGAVSAHYLLLSPTAKGLFHKLIAQSGCAMNIFGRGKPQPLSEMVAELQLDTTNEKEILEHLMQLSTEKLFEHSEKFVHTCDSRNNPGHKRPYAPIIEKPSEGAIITEEPIKIINSGNYNKVPILFGYNSREGMFVEIIMKPLKPSLPKNFETVLPFMLELEPGSIISRSVAEKIRQFYFGPPGSDFEIDSFYLLHTDNYFVRDMIRAAKLHSATSPFPVYLYRLSLETDLNIYKRAAKIVAPGVAHGDDIGYLFKTQLSPEIKPGSIEEISIKKIVNVWTNFARYGCPHSKYEPNLDWKSVSKNEVHFVDIGNTLTPGVNPEFHRLKFWDNIFDGASHL